MLVYSAFGLVKTDNKAITYVVINILPLVIGVVMCGWGCPAGLIQDLVFIRNFNKKYNYEVPTKVHKILRLVRYIFAILLITGIVSFSSKILWQNPTLIQRNINSWWSGIPNLDLVFYVSAITIIISVFINRFFCRYLCPFGAMGGIKSLLRPLTINKNKSCTNCKMCDKVCPMKIEMSKIESSCSPNCINCWKCIENCPKKALYIGTRNYTKSLKEWNKGIK
ncbi:MAG: 4Fe-4S binding protein [Rickettsiales bacterium]|nr:4Fe-4S binding protein [Rickettsiales bacterium]